VPNHVNEITSQRGGVNRTLTYDLNGSVTSDGGTRTFEWDGANRLVAINYTGFTTRSEFTYDGLNRIAKIVEKTGTTTSPGRATRICGSSLPVTGIVSQRMLPEARWGKQKTIRQPTLLFGRGWVSQPLQWLEP
jgi:YD repeat-containing protein